MSSLLSKIFCDANAKYVTSLQPIVSEINALEPEIKKLNDDELKAKTAEFKSRLYKGETLDDILAEAFACVREAARRTLGQRHFDAQLLGGIVLHRGEIAEMRTGEGKTLTATLSIYLNALSGAGAHLITVNDYLAKRDAVWMGQIYYALGLSVASVQHESAFIYDPSYKILNPKSEILNNDQNLNSQNSNNLDKERDEKGSFEVVDEFLRPCARRAAYQADITYGTNNEFGFDYLRDNLVYNLTDKVQRDFNYAIVDEVDSILIDEARTPLIISGPAEDSSDMYYKLASIVKTFAEADYEIDEKYRSAVTTESGDAKIEKAFGISNMYDESEEGSKIKRHKDQAIRAEKLFLKDKDYVVKDGEVIIVDEFTGRMMPGRRYSEGLHQAIEAKERVLVQRESITLATVTFQNYFRLYKKLAGMTGTAATSAEEFHKVYNLDVTVLPTNKPMVRHDLVDRVYKNETGKFQAVIAEIKARHEKGQPVLIGTVSIEKNELLSELLEREGIPHQILNAKNHEKEAQIIAQAGRLGAVTLATNMAGRGVDIVLGGNPPDSKAREEILKLGGLHVIGTERHEARRIDNQLRGRTGRQGDPGSTQFYVSLEDDVMRIFGSSRLKFMMDKMGIPDDMPIENKMVSRAIESAQSKVEGHNFDLRKHLLEYDDVTNKQRETIYRKRDEILNLAINNIEGDGEIQPAELQPSSSLKNEILDLVAEEISEIVNFNLGSGQGSKEINETINTIFPLAEEEKQKIAEEKNPENYLLDLARKKYEELEEQVNTAFKSPEGGQTFARLQGSAGLVANPTREIEKSILLRSIDTLWIEHLEALDYVKTGIGLRGYGQRDPLVEYKKESFKLFHELLLGIRKQVVYSIYKVGLASELTLPKAEKPRNLRLSGAAKTMEKGRSIGIDDVENQFSRQTAPRNEVGDNIKQKPRDISGHKVGRNDPCPCGSGKKYKKCCGK